MRHGMFRIRSGVYLALRMGFFVAAVSLPVAFAALAQERPTQDSYLFTHSDRNGDRGLSMAEFASVYHVVTRGASPQGSAEAAFTAADTDGNGVLDRSEFAEWFRTRR